MESHNSARLAAADPTGAIDAFREKVRGPLLVPSDAEYESARKVFNSLIDRHPALILRCAGAADVVQGVHFARESGLPLAIRGGGHSVAGNSVCNHAMVLDLSRMKGIRVDPVRQEADAQPGLTLGDVDRETHAFGLATPLGIVSNTGIAGLTLGGGIGWLNGKYGLACDNVVRADVVLADGRLVTVSADQHDDLFWAIRGGSGNFGIVTSFRYRLRPVRTVWAGMVIHPIAHAREVLLAFDTFAHESVDDISTMAAVLTGPDGELAVALAACFCGPIADGERVLRPLRTIGSPVADLFRQMPYPVFQTMFDASFESGFYHYWNASFLERITEPVIDATVAFMKRKPSPNTVLAMQQLHGAAARVPADSTAFVHRRSHYDFGILSVWANPAESRANIEWTKEFFATVQPHLEAGVYVNSLGEDDSRVHAAYGANYPRLLAIKRQYDPGNLFRLNHNIDPLST